MRFTLWMVEALEKKPKLKTYIQKLAEAYSQQQGYRKHGLLKDDLASEDSLLVQEALKRLTEQEMFDRNFRIKRANELNFRHETLPKEKQPTAKDDIRYLRNHIIQVMKEELEKKKYEPK